MEGKFCSQGGPGCKPPVGILFERTPDYVDVTGHYTVPQWRRIGAMCGDHLEINGQNARSNGYETKIEPLPHPGIEAKA